MQRSRSVGPLLGCFVTWIVMLMTSSVFAQTTETLHYDEDMLKNYVRLGQQIKAEMKRMADDIVERIFDIKQSIDDADAELKTKAGDAMIAMQETSDALANITRFMKLNYVPVVVVWALPVFTTPTDPFYTHVLYDHGTAFRTNNGQAIAIFSGLYQVEYRLQTHDYYAVSIRLSVYGPDGVKLHSYSYNWLAACPPVIESFELDAGSRIQISEVLPYGTYPYVELLAVTPGVASQFVVRYFGPV